MLGPTMPRHREALPAQILPPPMEHKARPQAGGPGQEVKGAPIPPQQLRDPVQIIFLGRILLEAPVYPL